jgi:hypothetical protein
MPLRFMNKTVQKILPFTPLTGVIVTVMIVGSAVAQCAPDILAAGIPKSLHCYNSYAYRAQAWACKYRYCSSTSQEAWLVISSPE